MTPRRERAVFAAAALGLWLLFFVQAVNAPVLLDDWFQLRYWRDHEFGPSALWAYGRHNYLHYNPRIGDVLVAIVDSSRLLHLVVSPLVQLAALVTTFVIAFGRWPRRTLRDLQLLLFIQVMIWLVIPIPGIIYFYRPIATNYLWAFTFTLALFVPYRLALASGAVPSRPWLAPIMLALGWVAGMCNEHTGPTAMVAMAGFVYVAWRRRQVRAWMVSGLVGLYIGYPMLFLAPGQSMRYGGLATRDTPSKLLSERGIIGCLKILFDFISESRLGIALFVAAVVRYVVTTRGRGERLAGLPRETSTTAVILVAASAAMVVTLFASPMTTDRVFYASGVLLAAAFAVCAEQMFVARSVRHLVVGACMILFAYHAARFIEIYVAVKAENEQRIAILRATRPGTVAFLPPYEHDQRSRWHIGDDFKTYPWLAEYVATEMFDLANASVAGTPPRAFARYQITRSYDPPLDPALEASIPARDIPTYRQWMYDPVARLLVGAQLVPYGGHRLVRFTVTVVGLPFDDPRHRPIIALEWTPSGYAYVEGSPDDASRGHVVRLRPTSLPNSIESTFVIGCGQARRVELVFDSVGPLLPIDERECRGAFTAVMCEPDRCWIAGWY
ncbi:MAG TPA: DUF6056 family protein [Kofleriaceae bacterium]|nr:DUF6056 family protein [Kofleriaceae bacterium]